MKPEIGTKLNIRGGDYEWGLYEVTETGLVLIGPWQG